MVIGLISSWNILSEPHRVHLLPLYVLISSHLLLTKLIVRANWRSQHHTARPLQMFAYFFYKVLLIMRSLWLTLAAQWCLWWYKLNNYKNHAFSCIYHTSHFMYVLNHSMYVFLLSYSCVLIPTSFRIISCSNVDTFIYVYIFGHNI